jgi:multicomponent Na+:H+ antiporter subunit D
VSISGVPLFSGFVSKELIVDAARTDGLDVVVILLKLASVGTFVSVALKLPWFTFGGGPRTEVVRPVPPTMIAAMALAAAANVAIGVRPELMYDLMPFAVAGDGATPTVTPTAVLGGLAMGAFVLILLLGLVS